LEELERQELDARATFDWLREKHPTVFRLLNSRFGHWLARAVFKKYFHGFGGKYSACFVFKWEQRHIPHRLYGFLCHPMPQSFPAFELCVLTCFATKGDDTNYTILDRINRLLVDMAVKEAIAQTYPEFRGRQQWTN
jgi:hypothetical protein